MYMDHRDAMSEFGTYLKSLPDFEFDREKMEATFVESGEDRDIDSPPPREQSPIEIVGRDFDQRIAEGLDRFLDVLKERKFFDNYGRDSRHFYAFKKHLHAWIYVSKWGWLSTYKDTRRIPSKAKLRLTISLPKPEGWKWNPKLNLEFRINGERVQTHEEAQENPYASSLWTSEPFQFFLGHENILKDGLEEMPFLKRALTRMRDKGWGPFDTGRLNFGEIGRRLNRLINGEVTPQDLKPQLDKLMESQMEDEAEPSYDCSGNLNGWYVSDKVLAKARRELGDWVLHFLCLQNKVHTVHLEWDVCGTCNGRGKHVNPSIDAHGISADEFYEDPDFAEDYHRGVYDVQCYECGGRTTSPVIDMKRTSEETIEFMNRWFEDEASYRREVAAERRMGC
jgi:hypothetical protein